MPWTIDLRHPSLSTQAAGVLLSLDTHAVAHGWTSEQRVQARTTVAAVLHSVAEVPRITVQQLRACGGPATLLAPALAALGLLEPVQDRLVRLIDQRTASLPAGIRADITTWMRTLHDGGARTKPKSWKTVYEYSANVRPTLLLWAQHHEHLREISSAQVSAALATVPVGSRRRNVAVALRALFRFLHQAGRIFVNPTSRIPAGDLPVRRLLPLTPANYQKLADHLDTDLKRVVFVLAAIHGARPGAIRNLQLTDVDVTRRRLTLGGVQRELDPLSCRTLTHWLLYRRRRWPLTANPHVLVNLISASGIRPISTSTMTQVFQGSGFTPGQVRADRVLEEALAHGPDPLHLAHVFAISRAAAVRYAMHAKDLMRLSAGGALDVGN